MRRLILLLAVLATAACRNRSEKKVIVFGVDGMDPGFVERHWADLPALDQLRREGAFSRLATTDPPQSPVAWSSFITGLEPGEHGIFDFVHRDPLTEEPYLSITRTVAPRLTLSLGPYRFPLRGGGVELLRHGTPFWETLADKGIPVTIIHMPANFPPSQSGEQLAGMGVPDLRGTQGTYTHVTQEGDTQLTGPPNTLRKDQAAVTLNVRIDIDSQNPVARFRIGANEIILNEGEWSNWLPLEFPLIPHLASSRGMVRIFAKQLHPEVSIYISPVNLDPEHPALPISTPPSLARTYADAIGRYPTLGIPQDTAALRMGILSHEEFLAHTKSILNTERSLLTAALDRYKRGLLFFYFSSIDQNSHMLWGKYDSELLQYYKGVDAAIADTRHRQPTAQIIVMSDHGFTSFDRAVNLNAWLRQQGLEKKARALGLNALYLGPGVDAVEIRRRLLELKDAENDNHAAITAVSLVKASITNRAIAPTMIIGYAPGYRASWATGLGETADHVFEANDDAWIGDHCVDPKAVPGVLFTSKGTNVTAADIRSLSTVVAHLFEEGGKD
ncbi:MAG: type phosphodiesterase/nucleotide pyrophosphatase [Bryobacterales bacterium]|nr:type phosphodiesterase/nucleotide pyrophosphatase [Bryobacterales bacterium]